MTTCIITNEECKKNNCGIFQSRHKECGYREDNNRRMREKMFEAGRLEAI